MFGVGIFVTFAQRYKLSGTTGIARGLPLKLTRGIYSNEYIPLYTLKIGGCKMSNNELIIIPKIEKYTKFKIYQPKERIINELDQYAKHKLKCKYYYRYMDGATRF